MAKIFRSAQLCLEFRKNRDGSEREHPYVMQPENGRVTVPDGVAGSDDQGRSAYLSIARENGDETAVFLEGHQIALIDETTQTRIVFDGAGIVILRGHGADAEFYKIPPRQ